MRYFLLLIGVLLLPSVVSAQAVKTGFEDVPDEFILEATAFEEACRNNHKQKLYFDCRCLSIKYLEARIERGKEAPVSAIENMLGDSCKDGTGIAGQLYEECLSDFVAAPLEKDPEEFCSCYGNTFAQYFENLEGRLTVRARGAFKSRARLRCRNPETANELYGPDRLK